MQVITKLKQTIDNLLPAQTPPDTHPSLPLDLGTCSDGLPVRVDLGDNNLRPLLVLSSQPNELKEFTGHILHNLVTAYAEGQAEVALLKRRSSNFAPLIQAAQEKGLLVNLAESSPRLDWEFLIELARRAEARYQQPEDPMSPILVLIEDLSFIRHAAHDIQWSFEWLLQYGAQVLVHVITAVNCEDGLQMARWLRFFTTRLFGTLTTEQQHHFNLHTDIPAAPPAIRYNGTTFAVWNHNHWLFFLLKNPPTTIQEIDP
ncbi:MAG TPA: hypothetical protein ENN32_07005 [Chloroflexi bacterium]|nr:hypothetical protein [Chloroflexota bacterium]